MQTSASMSMSDLTNKTAWRNRPQGRNYRSRLHALRIKETENSSDKATGIEGDEIRRFLWKAQSVNL
jgi:hypothetical protein